MSTPEPLGESFIFDPDRAVAFDDVGGGDSDNASRFRG